VSLKINPDLSPEKDRSKNKTGDGSRIDFKTVPKVFPKSATHKVMSWHQKDSP